MACRISLNSTKIQFRTPVRRTPNLSASCLLPFVPVPTFHQSSVGRRSFHWDPEKAARAIFDVATCDAQKLPVRLPLGSVALKVLVEKAKKTLNEAETWEEVSHGTNFDGVGRDAIGGL